MFRLLAQFSTDDDATLVFEGDRYCFYGDDLKIDRTLPTAQDCYNLLRSIVCTEHKGGITELFNAFIENAIHAHWMDYSADWSCWSGNQEFDINFIQVESRI